MSIEILFPEAKSKCVTFSYDDGRDFDKRLVEIFNKYKVKATFHLPSSWLGNDGYIKPEEVKEVYAGHEVACHALTHPYLTQLPKERMIQEVLEDRRNLEALVGYPVRGMSYPFGVYSNEVCSMLKELGIEYCRTVNDTNEFPLPTDYICWDPTSHHDEVNEEMIEKFLNPPEYVKLQLLYIWGHSFEFDSNDNWNKIEEICEGLANRDDVWYATNIEIKDYLDAAKGLKISVDQTIVKNPSATTVWFKSDQEVKVIHPGETLCLK